MLLSFVADLCRRIRVLRIQELRDSPCNSDSEAGENEGEVICIILAVLNLVYSFDSQRKWLVNFMD